MMEFPVEQPISPTMPPKQGESPLPKPVASAPFATGTSVQPLLETAADYWRQLRGFWRVYQKPLILGAVLFLAGIYAYIIVTALLAVLSALFVVAGVFKLIGFGYSTWFIYRYLLWFRTREELKQRFEQLKAQVLGFAHHIVE
jgi:hypothetical protein